MLQNIGILLTREGLGQLVSDATFFSRSSKSLRSVLDARLSLMSRISFSIPANLPFIWVTVFFRTIISILDIVDFSASWPTIPVTVSTFSLKSFRPSPKTLNWPRRSSISAPTSVGLNLSSFLTRFFMSNSVMERDFFVKQKISGVGTRREKEPACI